jgi:hypothetical protein
MAWLALDMAISTVSGLYLPDRKREWSLRSKAYTTGIFLKARVIQALLLWQSLTPAIALLGLVGSVLFLNL